MTTLSSESFVFDPRPDYPFLITAKRYWDPSSTGSPKPDALTCVFCHGCGFNKESWQTTIETIYSVLGDSEGVSVREAWSIDAPNHGDAAALNEATLKRGYTPIFQWEEYARAVHAFVTGLGSGLGGLNLSARENLVGIGHSMGGSAIMLSTTFFPRIPYAAIHLVEPMLVHNRYEISPNKLELGAVSRRDIWPTHEDAYRSLKSRAAFREWADTELRNYVEYGLRHLPTLDYPDKTGVTLKCSKIQEAAIFRDQHGRARSYGYLPTFLERYPVHIIYGAIDDHLLAEVKEQILHEASGGITKFAGVWRIPDAGHLALQSNPQGTAKIIAKVLRQTADVSQHDLPLHARL